jgi:hypothetical protein
MPVCNRQRDEGRSPTSPRSWRSSTSYVSAIAPESVVRVRGFVRKDPWGILSHNPDRIATYSIFQLSKVRECEVQWGAEHPTVLHTLEKGYIKQLREGKTFKTRSAKIISPPHPGCKKIVGISDFNP